MNNATAPVSFQHHDTFASIPEMDTAASIAGFLKVPDSSRIGFHYERPPGPCPDHGGRHVWWTQKRGVSWVGGPFSAKLGIYSYS